MPRPQSRFAAAAKARKRRPLSKAQRLALTPRLPRAAELRFALLLRQVIAALASAIGAVPLAQFAKQPERTDASDDGSPTFKRAAKAVAARARAAVAAASKPLALRIQQHSQGEFKRLGISLRKAEPGLGALIDAWRELNVSRVTSLVDFERDALTEILTKGEGQSVETLRDKIEERLDVSRSKADLLARDQVLTLNSQITQERHKAAGIESYRWTTAGDERVRDSHEEIDGDLFYWDDPPTVDGVPSHPGEPINCRCVAFPVLPEL